MGCSESTDSKAPGAGTATQSGAGAAKGGGAANKPPAPSVNSAAPAGSSAATAPKTQPPAVSQNTAPPASSSERQPIQPTERKPISGPGSATDPAASASATAPPLAASGAAKSTGTGLSTRSEAAQQPLPDSATAVAPTAETVYVNPAETQQARDEIQRMGEQAKQARALSQSAPDVVESAPAAADPDAGKPKRVKVTVDTAQVQKMMTDDVSRYELGKTLGKGAYGTVKAAKDKQTKGTVAVKVVSKELLQKEKGGEDRLYREVAIMGRLHHKNLVNMMQLVHNSQDDELWIIVEIVVGKGQGGKGELMHLIDSSEHHRLPEEISRSYFQQLVYGMNYVHSQKIAHRDLKPENILITADEVLKITDFGLSNVQNTDTMGAVVADMNLKTCCGTPYYVAPEVVNKDKKGYSGFTADIWSMGVILFVMLTGNLPFTVNKPDLKKLLQKIRNGDFTIPSTLEGGGSLSDDACKCIKAILNPNFETRVKMHEIARLAWLQPGFNIREMDTEEIEVSADAEKKMREMREEWSEAKKKAKASASNTISAAGATGMRGGGADTRAQYEAFRAAQAAKK